MKISSVFLQRKALTSHCQEDSQCEVGPLSNAHFISTHLPAILLLISFTMTDGPNKHRLITKIVSINNAKKRLSNRSGQMNIWPNFRLNWSYRPMNYVDLLAYLENLALEFFFPKT